MPPAWMPGAVAPPGTRSARHWITIRQHEIEGAAPAYPHGQQKDAVGVSLESSFSDYCGVDPCHVVFRSPNDIMGGDLGGLGDGPPKLEVGTAHAFVAPIFREVVLLDACESMN